MNEGNPGVTRAVLEAYAELTLVSWPTLHPTMIMRAPTWSRMSESELRAELDRYVAEASRPGCAVGLFWKLGPGLTYEGANANFLAAAGCARLGDLVGRDDFDPSFPWGAIAAKFRADDRRVLESAEPLSYIERQQADSGYNWNRVAKTPIRDAEGAVIGLFAMYERLEPEIGRKLYWQQVTEAVAIAV